MNFSYPSGTRHPFLSLLSLLFWWVVGFVASSVIALVVCLLLSGSWDLIEFQQSLYSNVNYMKVFQVFTVTGSFIVPAIVFARQQNLSTLEYLHLNRNFSISLLLFAIVVFFVLMPFLEWSILLNQNMKLPASLKFIEEWIKAKEDEMNVAMKLLLTMKSPSDFVVNLFVIAVLAGVSEELFFRGCIQQIFIRWTKNYHAGVWLAAVIFSAIHMQFYGFLPRMLLGALFGYFFYFSKNLLVPMIVHAVNNGIAVVGAYQLQLKGESLDLLDSQASFPVYAVILSLIFGVFLLIAYKWFSLKQGIFDEQELG